MEENRQLETIRNERTLLERTRELVEPLTGAFQQLSARQKQVAYSLFAVVAIAVVAIVFSPREPIGKHCSRDLIPRMQGKSQRN